MDLELNNNELQDISTYFDKHSFMAYGGVRANLRHVREQFINTSKKYGNVADYEWIKIEDEPVAELILKAFADDDKKKILDYTLSKSKTPVEIIDACKLPPTSGYRKIKSLIRDGLLASNGTYVSRSKKQIRRYVSALEDIKIDICRGKLAVKVKFTKV